MYRTHSVDASSFELWHRRVGTKVSPKSVFAHWSCGNSKNVKHVNVPKLLLIAHYRRSLWCNSHVFSAAQYLQVCSINMEMCFGTYHYHGIRIISKNDALLAENSALYDGLKFHPYEIMTMQQLIERNFIQSWRFAVHSTSTHWFKMDRCLNGTRMAHGFQ